MPVSIGGCCEVNERGGGPLHWRGSQPLARCDDGLQPRIPPVSWALCTVLMNFLNEGGPYEQSELTRLSNIHLTSYYAPVIRPKQVLLESTTEMTGKRGWGGVGGWQQESETASAISCALTSHLGA